MKLEFDGKYVLVTGGNSGIGLGTAKYFVEQGATVFISARRQKELDEVAAELGKRAIAVACDITVQEDLDRLFRTITERAGQLDVVVANAGGPTFGAIGQYTHEALDACFGLNVKGTVFTVQGALPLMRPGGSIVLMSSIEGDRGSASLGMYAATKAALKSFARTWANELRDRGIRVNAISPGVVYTPAYAAAGLSRDDIGPFVEQIPVGRSGTEEEIGRTIAFLASDGGAFINATDLVADGGMRGIV